MMRLFAVAAVALPLLGAFPAIAQQPARTVTGVVRDAESGAPVEGARVSVKALSSPATVTRVDGQFSLRAPETPVTLVVRHIGHLLTEMPVPAERSTVTIQLRSDPLQLDGVVITGQATAVSRRNSANSVEVVSGEDLARVSAVSLEHSLQAKVPGTQIQQNTGAPGGGNRARIRGSASINGSVSPLYVLDGLIVSDVAIAGGTNQITKAGGGIADVTQDNPVNRIVDLNPDDIENVEVLKGSSAAAIYGAKAAGGVIIITTKRGRAGPARFSLRTGMGTSRLAMKQGARRFATVAAARAAFDPNNIQGDAAWATLFQPDRFIDYEDEMYGRHPLHGETVLTASGGSDVTRVFVSVLDRREEGIVLNTFSDKKSIRVNVDQSVGSRTTVSLGTELLRTSGDRGLFGNDNSGTSASYALPATPSFLDIRRRGDGTYPVNPFWTSNPLQTVDLFQNRETVWRALSTLRVSTQAVSTERHQLRLDALAGIDLFDQGDDIYAPPQLFFEDDDGLLGTAVFSRSRVLQYNLNLAAVHSTTLRGWLQLTSQAGTQLSVFDRDVVRTVGQNLLGGVAQPTAGTTRDLSTNKSGFNDFGVFAQTEALLHERVFLSAGVRGDRSSNNGDVGRFFVFPKFAASYRLPSPPLPFTDELKLRLAYGETGNPPSYGQKFSNLGAGSVGGISAYALSGTRGSPTIHPERQRELEGGVDLALFDSRAQLEVTAYQRNVSELLLSRAVPPSLGYSSEIFNAGDMRLRGMEVLVNAYPIRSSGSGLSWNTHVTLGLNRSKVTRLAEPLAPFGTSLAVGQVLVEVGGPITQLIGVDTVAVAGQCPAGSIDRTGCEALALGATRPVYIDDANPVYNAGWSNELRWHGMTVYGLLDRQRGGRLRAGSWQQQDGAKTSRDYDDPSPDPNKTLGKYRADQAARSTALYYQDASYVKLREASLSWDLPSRVVRRLRGTDNVRLSATGRNLVTWTKFRGSDPDFMNFGANVPDAIQRNRELASYPASRQFWLTLQVGF